MKDGPDLSRIASLVGDPARANMLSALMSGTALTASELALEAGVSLPTASSHLAKLSEGGLVTVASQGRHRYYALAGSEVAAMLEAISGVAASVGPKRVRPGPRDGAMREARICYDHLAGEKGVALFDHLTQKRLLKASGQDAALTAKGRAWFSDFGIDIAALEGRRRPLCRACLDWSVRRSHLAGSLGAAALDRMFALNWARRESGSRVVRFTPKGRAEFERLIRA
ncbi:MAG: winged helix-turn-helix transcriptional regulator [Rhizobiaceae bacterium]|nr:winged helix-turn-helix transcriptional regulator [Rhizobiaceae bacterium]